MLKIFRGIRKMLIGSSQGQKYLLYAIGEIALVVIGILIALQINNWNEGRKNRITTEKIMQNLFNEFEQNRQVLGQRKATLYQSIDYSKIMLSMTGMEEVPLSQNEIDSILTYTMYYGNFNPSNSTIEELIHTGKLELLSDDTLKSLLFDWLGLLHDTSEDFNNQDLKTNRYLVPYLTKHVSFRNLSLLENYNIKLGASQLVPGDYVQLLNDLEFENLMTENILWHTIMLEHFKDLDELAGDILQRLEFLYL